MTELERVIIGLTIFQKYKNPDIFGPIIIIEYEIVSTKDKEFLKSIGWEYNEEKTQWEMYV